MDRIKRSLSAPWAVAAVLMICLIWGNSLVPGTGSSSISLAVRDALRALVGGMGLPTAWITNFLVRKTAHFTEYAVLGVLASQALGPGLSRDQRLYALLALVLVAVPSIDESIQLHIAGRSGQLADVLLDCCGAATGAVLRALAARRRRAAARR